MAFSASESAFEGFRIVRREPATVAIWALLLLIVSAAGAAVIGPTMQGMVNLTPGTASTAASKALLAHLGLIYLVAIPLELIAMAVMSAAVYRAILRPEEKGFARLRLGLDELRLIGLYLLLGLFFFAIFLVVGIVAALLAAGAFAATGSGWGRGVGLFLVMMVLYLGLIAAWAWLGVKFSFAAPMTFAQKRIRMFGSWGATKGKFWPLLGCYLLAFVFVMLIVLVNVVISSALMFAVSGGSFSGLTALVNPKAAVSAMNLLSPVYIVRLVVGAVFGVMLWTVALAPAAKAYREIAGPRPEDQAEAFS